MNQNGYEDNIKKILEKYGRDITESVKSGKVDPVIGRDEEIRNISRILSRKTKNNSVLIGEPGVGKTAIVEGLAARIIKGDVPLSLKNKRVWELDMGSLVAAVSLDSLTRKIMGLEVEREAIKKVKDDISKNRILEIDKVLNDLKGKEKKFRTEWEAEKGINNQINKKKEELENANHDLEYAESKYDLENAARLRHGIIPELQKQLESLISNNKSSLLSDVVDDESIAEIISKWTHIPISKLVGDEKGKTFTLER